MTTYEYELRREGEVIATGRIQLEQAPTAGDTLRLGSSRVRVVEVVPHVDVPRLILAA